jgi:ketosteroid isomerase-like protein
MRLPMRVLLVSFAVGVAAGCSPSGPAGQTTAGTAADEAVIRAGTDTWNTAYNAGEVDRIVALYADDAVVMPPNVPAISGHEAIKEYLTKDVAAAKAAGLTAKDGTSAVGVSSDLAWHAGTSSVIDAAGKTVETGKYTEVWRRTNGKWLIVRDIWNDDALPAPTPPH